MPAITKPSTTPAADKTLWETPPALFSRLNEVFHFNLDVCAEHHTAKCSSYFVRPADCEYCGGRGFVEGPGDGFSTQSYPCLRCDGLRQPWAPHRCWLNPPYGRAMPPWLERAGQESRKGALVVALIPDDTSTRWYHDLVHGKAQVQPLDGRVKFVGAPGMPNFGSLLAIYWPGGFWKGN